jgi:hypothetical protein
MVPVGQVTYATIFDAVKYVDIQLFNNECSGGLKVCPDVSVIPSGTVLIKALSGVYPPSADAPHSKMVRSDPEFWGGQITIFISLIAENMLVTVVLVTVPMTPQEPMRLERVIVPDVDVLLARKRRCIKQRVVALNGGGSFADTPPVRLPFVSFLSSLNARVRRDVRSKGGGVAGKGSS